MPLTGAATRVILAGIVSLLRAPTPLLLSFGLACASPTGSAPAPAPAAPASSADVEAQGRSVREPITLHPIAVREGNLDLAHFDGHAYLLLDGEPVPLAPGLAPERQPALARGLPPIDPMFFNRTVVAIGGQLERGPAYLVTRQDMERAGSSFETLVYGREGWRPLALDHGSLQGFYQAILTLPGDVVVALRGFEYSLGELPDIAHEDSPEARAWWAELEAERAAAPYGFEVLAGSPAQLPELPADWIPSDAVATTDGRVVALASQPGLPYDDESDEPWTEPTIRLLDWAPGAAQPEIHSLPGLDPETLAYSARLWPANERVIVSAWSGTANTNRRPYLAIGRAGEWTALPVDLPGLDQYDRTITSATLDDAGELWVTVGSAYYDSDPTNDPSLWRHSAGSWLPVELPVVAGEAWAGRGRWLFASNEQRWFEIPPVINEPGPPHPVATQVQWVDDALWVVARVGRVYPEIDEIWVQQSRSIAYASRPVDGVPLLASYDQVERERVDAYASTTAPGEPGCRHITIVVADRPTADRQAAIVARASALARPPATEACSAHSLYRGALLDDPSHTQLVYDTYAWSPRDVTQLLDTISQALGVQAQADCRPRAMVEMLIP